MAPGRRCSGTSRPLTRGEIDWDISIDSTSIRAHLHAAGASKAPPPTLLSTSKRPPERSARAGALASVVVHGGGGAAAEATGRSRGGLTMKLHLSADGKCRPLSLVVMPGQRADCTQFEAVMDKIRVPRLGPGRPRRRPDSVGADKAYSNRGTRAYLRKRGIQHVIPEKRDQAAGRLCRGSRGGRPPGLHRDRKACLGCRREPFA
ncbi:transposase [Streptomyces microflavus]|uniref:transposase n=1 Tax=Streptomyces microflavus TaxID=1919 RepID=UPI0037F57F73